MGFLVGTLVVLLMLQAEITFMANKQFYYARNSKNPVKHHFLRRKMLGMNFMFLLSTTLSVVAIHLLLKA